MRISTIAAALVLCLGTAPLRAQTCPAGPHALVLSGGGARGFAELGIVSVIDSLALRPDFIVGTSSGALLGALYANGYSARQIDSIVRAVGLAGVFRGGAPLAPRAFGAVTPLLFWEHGRGGLNVFSTSALDARLNARLNEALLDANLAAGGDFANLGIPFTAVAADLVLRERVLLRHGDLARSVRASMSIPLLFRPQEIEGRFLVDGAVVDNIPVTPARQLGAATLTVVDVTTGATDSVDVHSTTAIARHLLEQQMLDSRDSIGPFDSYIRPDLAGFGNLDFTPLRLREAPARGAAAARAAMAARTCMPARGAPRNRERSNRIGEVSILAARGADRRFLQSALGLTPGDTVDQARIRAAFRAMERSPEPRELWLNPRRTADGISFGVVLASAPKRAGGILLGYDHDYGGRIGALLLDRSLFGGYAQLAASIVASRFQQRGTLALRPEPVSWNPIVPALHLRLAHEALQQPQGDAPPLPSIDTWDGEVQLALERVVAARWSISAGPLLHLWDTDLGNGSSVGFQARAARGSEQRRPFTELSGTWTQDWWSAAASVEAEGRRGIGRVIARAEATADAPPHRMPALGGSNGFPGFTLFDLRGRHTAYAEVSGARSILGPFDLRLAVAGGRSWESHTDTWLGGARLTLELPTPAGALRVGYGRSTAGTAAVFVRLGAWF